MKYLSYSVADHLSLHPPPHHHIINGFNLTAVLRYREVFLPLVLTHHHPTQTVTAIFLHRVDIFLPHRQPYFTTITTDVLVYKNVLLSFPQIPPCSHPHGQL
jgi:hypothetical protein